MSDPARGALRLARLCAFVVACLGLGAAGHAVGGGGLPAMPLLLLTVPAVALVGLWFTRRERGVGALFGALTAIQAALHGLFHACHAGAASREALASVAARAGHAHGGTDLGTALAGPASAHVQDHASMAAAMPSGGSMASGASMAMGASIVPSGSMLAAHLIAIGLTALALGWGERSLWALARRLFPRLPCAALPPYPARPQPTATPAPLRAADVLRRAPVRGPPASLRPA